MDDLHQFTEQLVQQLSLELVTILTNVPGAGGTPIDTGWARSNWLPSVGKVADGPVGSKMTVTFGPQAAGIAALAGYHLEQGTVFLANHVHYITRLNDGSSAQAPAGFVQAAIDRAIAEVRP